MERSKLGRFLDNFTICLISTLVFFLLFKTIIANNLTCIVLSLILGFILLKILLYFQNKKYKKLKIQKNEIKNIEKYNIYLRTLNSKEQINFFKEMFKSKNLEIFKKNFIIDKQILFIILLNQDEITPENIFNIYAENKNKDFKEIAVVCNKISSEAISTITNFEDVNFSIFTPIETYALMKAYNFYPQPINLKIKKKQSFIKQAFLKKQAKGFIRCGLLLYIAGVFVPFTKYYLLIGSICLVLGAICLCFGKKEIKTYSFSQQLLLN